MDSCDEHRNDGIEALASYERFEFAESHLKSSFLCWSQESMPQPRNVRTSEINHRFSRSTSRQPMSRRQKPSGQSIRSMAA